MFYLNPADDFEDEKEHMAEDSIQVS